MYTSRSGLAADAVERLVAEPFHLAVAVQPVVDLEAQDVAGYEVLSRVPPTWGLGPAEIFEAARRTGRSAELTVQVLRRTFGLLETAPPRTFLAVNVDPADLLDPRVQEVFRAQRDLRRVVVEITEHAWPAQPGQVTDELQALRDLGAGIAADDVGAGYGGLSQLMLVRPQMVKLDRGLVAALGQDPAAGELVEAVSALCQQLEASVVVGGVETETQLAALRDLDVAYAQGWIFGRAEPPWPDVDLSHLPEPPLRVVPTALTVADLVQPADSSLLRDAAGRYHRLGETEPCVPVPGRTGLRSAVSRALARPAARRWFPLLVVDEAGEALGVVPMETLVAAVAGTHEPASPCPAYARPAGRVS